MSRFFVGQRVRIRPMPNVYSKYRGAEAVFLCYGLELSPFPELGDDCCIRVIGEVLSAPSSMLEPILPSGHAPAELSVEELLPFLREREAA